MSTARAAASEDHGRPRAGPLTALTQRLWRLRPEDFGSVRLGHSRIYILPTRRGLAFAITVLLMLLATMNYGLGLGYALVFLLMGLMVSGLLHTFRNIAGIQIAPGADPEAFAGEPIAFALRLGKLHGEAAYAIDVSPPAGEYATAAIPAGNTVEALVRVTAARRGRIPLGRVALSSTYPLGLWKAWSYVHFPYSGWAYPAPESDAPPPPTRARGIGPGNAPTTGFEEMAGLRSWQPTDTPRQIAWKALARGLGLHSKEFTGSGGGDLVLRWEDTPASMSDEERLSRLTAWVVAADRGGARYGLSLPGAQLAASSGPPQRTAALRALAMFGLRDEAHAGQHDELRVGRRTEAHD